MLSKIALEIAKRTGVIKALGGRAAAFIQKYQAQIQNAILLGGFIATAGSFIVTTVLPILIPVVIAWQAYTAAANFVGNFWSAMVGPREVGENSSYQAQGGVGTCPLPGGFIIRGALGGSETYQHGTTEYWSMFPPGCGFALPVSNPVCVNTSNTLAFDRCVDPGGGCPEYGLSSDAAYPGVVNGPVYLPTEIFGETNLTWTSHSAHAAPCGYLATYRTNLSDGTTVELYYEHVGEPAPPSARSGEIVSNTLANCNNNYHLHYEMRINGAYVNPDSLCSGKGGTATIPTGPLHGWLLEVSDLSTSNLIGSQPTSPAEVGITTCDWARRHPEATYAVNGSFGISAYAAIGHTGYLGQFTNHEPVEGWGYFDFKTFHIDPSGVSHIRPFVSVTSPFTAVLSPTDKFAVTGVDYDNIRPEARPRTIVGTRGSSLVVVILKYATPAQSEQFMLDMGVTNGFFLDGGGSTTLCRGGTQLFTGMSANPNAQARSLSSHFGFKHAVLTEF